MKSVLDTTVTVTVTVYSFSAQKVKKVLVYLKLTVYNVKVIE